MMVLGYAILVKENGSIRKLKTGGWSTQSSKIYTHEKQAQSIAETKQKFNNGRTYIVVPVYAKEEDMN